MNNREFCQNDAQYSRLRDMMTKIDETSPTDVIALMRKCVVLFGQDLTGAELAPLGWSEEDCPSLGNLK